MDIINNMKKNILFSASFLSSDFTEMKNNIEIIESAKADFIHFDVMDGNFVPVITYGEKMISDCRKISKLPFDVHLMINRPEHLIPEIAAAGADIITIQAESTIHLHRVVTQISELKKKAGICIIPSTPIENIIELLPFVDLVLIMTVNPGYGAQEFIWEMLEKVKKLKQIREKHNYKYLLEVDGGINQETYKPALEAGVDLIVAGSAFFNCPAPSKFVEMIKGGF